MYTYVTINTLCTFTRMVVLEIENHNRLKEYLFENDQQEQVYRGKV